MKANSQPRAAAVLEPGQKAILASLKEGKIIIPPVEADMANPAWEAAAARILIVRLSPWRDVDISTPHLVLFDEIRSSMPGVFIDFAFMPTASDRKLLSSRNVPWFFGRASGKSPRDFDIVMISNAFALELVNLPYLFTTAGLSMSAASRSTLDDQPIFIAGGSNSSAMGALVLEGSELKYPARDAFVDGIFFGEGEGAIGRLARILSGADEAYGVAGSTAPSGRGGAPLRLARLAKAAEVQGFWPCLLAEGAQKATAPGRPHTVLKPLVLNGPSASSARLSITSGCPGYCSFCLEGWDRRPYAEADADRLIVEARKLRRATGAVDLEIYSFNFNTHSRIFDLVFELNRIFRRVSFMSQRLDILAETRGLIEVELAGGKRSFTLGIEGISESMRAFYRKGLTAEHIEICLEKTIRPGIKELKLFFIIAGTETTADIAEFAALMESIKRRKDANSPSTRILVSAGFLVRLPFTPLQYAPLEFDRDKLVRLGHLLGEACDQSGIEFRLAADVEESFIDQALSLGGSAAFRWLEKIPSLGFKYDVSLGEGTWKSLKPFIFGQGSDPSFVEEKSEEYRPPLAFIEESRSFALLHAHYIEAKNLVDRFSCLGKECSACGVCEDKAERSAMTGHTLVMPPLIRHTEKIEALLSAKSKFAAVFAAIDFPAALADSHPSYRASWLLRRFSEKVEGAENIVFEAKEILFSGSAPFAGLVGDEIGRFGRSAVALYGPDPKRAALLLSKFADAEAFSISGKHKSESLYAIRLKPLAAPPAPLHADLEITLPGDRLDDLRGAFEEFGSSQKLPFTTRREENGWSFMVSDSSKGRRILAGARLRYNNNMAILSLEAGEKARLSPLFELIEKRCGLKPLLNVVGWD